MPNVDISRYLNQPRQHYAGARLQQGQPLLDADFNEGAQARADLWRAALVDVVGAAGSRDDGFLPALKVGDTVAATLVRFGASTQAFVLDYALKAGSMYVGGALWEQADAEPVVFQRGFLQMGAATAPRAGLGEQRQLSYLRGWEQPVTAVEDGEIQEPALGGADTAARVRRVRRVEVRTVQATSCAAAFAEVLDDLGNGDTATHDAATGELRSNGRLRMTFQGSAAAECAPCQPTLEGRYLGGESHAIRVMLTAPDRYIWAYDNAAPLYRVRLVLDGAGGARVEMQTPPKDVFHQPRQQTVVELLPWEALLDNGRAPGPATGETFVNEKIAARVGVLAEVDGPYDVAARTFHVRLAPGSAQQLGVGTGKTDSKAEKQASIDVKTGTVPQQDGFALRWDPRHPFADQLNPTENSTDGFVTYLYLRVWHLKQTDEALTIPTSADRPLGPTGLVPVFTGRGRAGDFWIIAVRPEAPNEILPREIMLPGGVPPHGPREVVAPICLLTWRSLTGAGHEVVRIDDCRPTVPALTQRGCCTYDVGPGGDFATIQAAVDALPVTGGRLCVRAGVYREEVRIVGKSNVVVVGCGPRTRIESPPAPSGEALVHVELDEAGHDVTLRDLAVAAAGQLGVRVVGGRRVELRRLVHRPTAGLPARAQGVVQVLGTGDVRITDCHIETSGAFTHHAALYLDAPAGAVVERTTVEAAAARDNGDTFAWGGIHVASGSRGVELRDNDIRGGRGHGVTLGSVVFRALDGTRLGLQGAGRGQSNPAPPFSVTGVFGPVTADPDGTGPRDFFPEPQAAVDDLVAAGNRIEGAGGSGIASVALQVEHDERLTGPPLCFRRTTFALTDSVIEDNHLSGNARQRAASDGETVAVGGIVLSDAARVTVRGNLVEGSGADTEAPVCGIAVARGEHVCVVGNRVRDNGPPGGAGGVVPPRYHGGIVLAPPAKHEAELPRNVHVRRNVVDQPAAPALRVVSRGACQVTANHLHTHLPGRRLLAATVEVLATGRPWEAVDLPEGEPNPDRWRQPNGSREFLNGAAQNLPEGDGGALCFHGNQVTTNAETVPNLGGFTALLLSLDHLSALGNQFAARGVEESPLPQVAAIGLTTDVSVNRVAESINRTEISLGVMGAMLTACVDNVLTHCPVVFGCANNRIPDFFLAVDNLVWLRPPSGRCEERGGRVQEQLQRFCGLFGRIGGLTTGGRLDIGTILTNSRG